MGGEEKRRHVRVDCNIPIRLYVLGHSKPVEANIRNISISGAFVQALQEIPPGEKVLLEFSTSELTMIHARVASVKPPPSVKVSTGEIWVKDGKRMEMGVEFINIRPEVQEFINALIASLGEQQPA